MSHETEDQSLLLLDIVEAQLHNTVAASGSFLSIAQADFYPSESFRGNHGLLHFRRWSHHKVVGDKEGERLLKPGIGLGTVNILTQDSNWRYRYLQLTRKKR